MTTDPTPQGLAPSLQQQALEDFEELIHNGISNADVANIRRSLEGALAARPLLEEVARMGDRIGLHTVGEITAISDRAAAWLQENPPGQPVAVEPQGCPTPAAAKPPLWRVMLHATDWLAAPPYDNAPAPPRGASGDWTDRVGYVAQILAVRDRLFPGGRPDSVDCLLIWDELTTEAARAEAGE